MTRLACVGHNTVDKYVNLGMMYPGGNSVNVAVLARRYGVETSYTGWVGKDVYGELILNSLKEEGVNISHTHIKDDISNFTEIFLEGGERKFGKTRRGASSKFQLTSEDIEFLQTHDLIHTSYYGKTDLHLESIKSSNTTISFDFTDEFTSEYLNKFIPFVDVAILSLSNREIDDIETLMQNLHSKGPEIIICTKGEDGAYLFDGKMFHQPSINVEVVDTLGAGDGFIARFLVEYLRKTDTEEALKRAVQSASEVCLYYGAFERGIPLAD
jgi:fructoselysine 6-kinase